MRDDNEKIRKSIKIISEFRKLDLEMQMQTALIFLLIAQKEGCTSRDLERETGLSSASISRNIAALSAVHRRGRPGHNLVSPREGMDDRRFKNMFLTPKGRAVLETLMENF